MRHATLDNAAMLALLDLWDEGLSAAQIAKRLGLTRNQVVGIVHRCGMSAPRDKHDGTLPKGWWKAGLAVRDRGSPAAEARGRARLREIEARGQDR